MSEQRQSITRSAAHIMSEASHHNVADLSDDECIAIAMVQYGVQFKELGQGIVDPPFWLAWKVDDRTREGTGSSMAGAARAWLINYGGYSRG